MEYFKRETGHYVNRLLGRRKHTVWSAGFSDPVILDHEKALERLKYVYLNPVKARRCTHASNWPLSSMNWIKENRNLTVKRIPRNKVAKLPKRSMTLEEIDKAHFKLSFRGKELYTLKLEPDAWIECYTETKNRDVTSYNDYLSSEIKKEEEKFEKERPCPPTPLHIQATQNIRTEYQPQKFGKKMICLGSTKEIRVKFLDWYKTQCKKLPHFLKKVKNDIAQLSHYPPGFFAPGGFLSSNLIPNQTPFSELG